MLLPARESKPSQLPEPGSSEHGIELANAGICFRGDCAARAIGRTARSGRQPRLRRRNRRVDGGIGCRKRRGKSPSTAVQGAQRACPT